MSPSNPLSVLLINPPVEQLAHRMSPSSWTEQLGIYPPLGLMYLASFLEREGHRVTILDLVETPLKKDALANRIRSINPDIAGVSCLTFNLVQVLEVVRFIKSVSSRIVTVVGGPHATIYPRETAIQDDVDFVALGDGEEILARLAEKLDSPGIIPGLISRDTPDDTNFDELVQQVDREKNPLPARHLVPGESYRAIVSRRLPMTSMVTGTGCPYRCIFCSASKRANPYFRSVEHVIEEMQECSDLGYREVMFFDDIFTLDRERVLKLCRLINENGLDLAWDCRTRVDCVDMEMLKAMKKAGCYRVQYGVESGSPRILKTLNKRFTVEQAWKSLAETRAAGMAPSASFMIGNPQETEEDIKKTIDFAIQSDPDFAQFTITTPFPFTRLYDQGLKTGLYTKDYWQQFAQNPHVSFVPRYWDRDFDSATLINWQSKAFRKFYYRPRYIARQLLALKSFSELKRKALLAIKLAADTVLKS
jgi:radical SAM superfamily enzyme YgiQ (UPF0313 family)